MENKTCRFVDSPCLIYNACGLSDCLLEISGGAREIFTTLLVLDWAKLYLKYEKIYLLKEHSNEIEVELI